MIVANYRAEFSNKQSAAALCSGDFHDSFPIAPDVLARFLERRGHRQSISELRCDGALGPVVWLSHNRAEQWAKLRSDPSLIPHAINEVIRIESPIRAFARLTRRDYDIDGVSVPG